MAHANAYVWNYSSTSTSPLAKSVRLPNPAKSDDPLPLGAIVQSGSQCEPGLLLINARSGKVTYYENLNNADALSSLAHRRSAIEGLMGLYSGETVVNIENAHFAGFVVTTSNNRVAQLQLKDSQSRPFVNVHYLQTRKRSTSGGLLGGFLNVFSGAGLMPDVTATRLKFSSARGPAQLIIASEHGQFQQWKLSWFEPPEFLGEWQTQESLEATAREQLDDQMPSSIQSARLLDFDYVPASCMHEERNLDSEDEDVVLLGLFSVSGSSFQAHAICSIRLGSDQTCVMGRLFHLSSYKTPLILRARQKPKVCILSSYLTAAIFFDKALVVLSLPKTIDPDAAPNNINIFQDIVHLKDDETTYFTGAAAEGFDVKRTESSALCLTRTSGLLRVIVKESNDQRQALSGGQVSVKSKIEQAILYGRKKLSPLDFSHRPEVHYDRNEVEQAVVEISDAVLRSAYVSLHRGYSSIDQQMQRRLDALDSLARHVKDIYPGLSRSTRWMLLWDAEKLYAARELYKSYSAQIDTDREMRGDNDQRKYLLPELVERMHERNRSISASEWDIVSHLEHFLTFDTHSMNQILSWTYNAVYALAQDQDVRHSKSMLWLVCDASQAACTIVNSALAFRTEHIWLYDLEHEVLEDGVLKSGYEGLPVPWTSSAPTPNKIYELSANAQNIFREESIDTGQQDPAVAEILHSIAAVNPRLIAAWCLIITERIRWAAAQPLGTEHHQNKKDSRKRFSENLTELLLNLPMMEQTAAGMALAETYQEMSALTKLVREESADLYSIAQMYSRPSQSENVQQERVRRRKQEEVQKNIQALEKRIAQYCRKFGYAFTSPYYSAMVHKGNLGSLLAQSGSYSLEVTEFLHAEPNRRSLAWINDVISERDYSAANQALIKQISVPGQKIWDRGIELGFAKLALLAADEGRDADRVQNNTPGHLQDEDDQWSTLCQQHARLVDQASVVLSVQDKVLGLIGSISKHALDADAKIQLFIEALGEGLKKTHRGHLRSLLETSFENVVEQKVMGAEALVDILTLIDHVRADRPQKGGGTYQTPMDVFFLALLVVRNDPALSDSRRDILMKMCWRRAMLEDDWAELNDTSVQNRLSDADIRQLARETVLYRTFFEGFKVTSEASISSLGAVMDFSDGINAERKDETSMIAYIADMPTPTPAQCLAAGTTVEDWLLRFGEGYAGLAEPLAEECQCEEVWLQRALEKHQLEKWWHICRDIAVQEARTGR